MAFIPGYEHDVFVSYAHVDDRPFIDAAAGQERSSGWVSTLVRHLKNELAQKVGRSDAVSVWFDSNNLRGNHKLTDEIAARLAHAASFVAILSPGYIASQWCQDEAHMFARACGGDPGRRLFVIEKEPLDDEPGPPAFGDRRAYRFWYRDRAEQPRTFAIPQPRVDEIDYFRQIEDVARDLRNLCRDMRGNRANQANAPVGAVPITAQPRPATSGVFLAEVTDDLEFKREEVRRYLEQQSVSVLPQLSYPLGRAEFAAALDADLVNSRLFAQLLGPVPGKRPPDVPEGYGWLQLDGAQRRGLPILQWRSPDLMPEGVDWPRHRELLELETVQATSLESFKRAIMAALAPPPPPPQRPGTGERPLVFLNTELRHREIASQIRSAVGDRAVWAEPMFEGPAETVREDLEQNLICCDAMVMVYADNQGWVRAQLRNFHKLAPRRERPSRAILVDAPPEQKPELGFFLPDMVVIDGRHGLGPDVLGRLSASLSL
jgi:TIR domain